MICITCVVKSADGAAIGFYFVLVSLFIAHNYEIIEFEFAFNPSLDWFGSPFLFFLRLLLWFRPCWWLFSDEAGAYAF
jgi:hypothetical protein